MVGNDFHEDNGKCFIIAEAGVNHNGDIEIAKELVDAAKTSGSDAIKFQTFIVEELVGKKTSKPAYQKRSLEKNQYEMLKQLEFGFDDFLSQIQQVKKMGNMKDLMRMIPGMGKDLQVPELTSGYGSEDRNLAKMALQAEQGSTNRHLFPQPVAWWIHQFRAKPQRMPFPHW